MCVCSWFRTSWALTVANTFHTTDLLELQLRLWSHNFLPSCGTKMQTGQSAQRHSNCLHVQWALRLLGLQILAEGEGGGGVVYCALCHRRIPLNSRDGQARTAIQAGDLTQIHRWRHGRMMMGRGAYSSRLHRCHLCPPFGCPCPMLCRHWRWSRRWRWPLSPRRPPAGRS